MYNKELKIVTIAPDDDFFSWQIHLWLESLKELNLSKNALVLIFTPKEREHNFKTYQKLIDLYPEAEFKFYKDEHNISRFLSTYIPILRPYTAWRYWTDHPEMKDKAIFYCDSDILFTSKFNIDKFIDDDLNYASDTNSYINASYFDSKIKDVLPHKLEEYKKRDILDEVSRMSGINRKICEEHNLHSGGTQYLLKNLDADFWKTVMNLCVPSKTYLMNINKEFFGTENKGIQSWTIDMWLILWELWRRGQDLKVVPELDFCWPMDNISKIQERTIYHNAGVNNEIMNGYPCFFKGKYVQGALPTKDPHLDVILNNEESKKHCTWWYANKIDELRKKFKEIYL